MEGTKLKSSESSLMLLTHSSTAFANILVYTDTNRNPFTDSLLGSNHLNDLGLMKNPLLKICVIPAANLGINIKAEVKR